MFKKVIPALVFGIAAFIGWMAFPAADRAKFDFDAAAPTEQQAWLAAQAKPLAKRINLSLPKGDAGQPGMKVSAARVNAEKRVIEIDVTIDGPVAFRVDPSIAARSFGKQFCPDYTGSELGLNKIVIMHIFRDRALNPLLVFGVSPESCRQYMRA